MQDIILEVLCVGCGEPTTPNEVDWLLFRTAGLAVHNRQRCHEKAYDRLYHNRKEVSKENKLTP